jgi:hypothetical protein
MLKLMLMAASFLIISAASSADVIYRWRDARGVLHYSDTPPGEGARDVKMLKVPGHTENRSSNTAARRTSTPGGRAARVESGRSTSAGGAPDSGGVLSGGAAGGGTSGGGGGGGTSTASRTTAAGGGSTSPSGATTTAVATPRAPASSPAAATTAAITTPPAPATSPAPAPAPVVPPVTVAPPAPAPAPAGSTDPNTAVLAWDAVTDPNLRGYRIYLGTAPGTYFQSVGQGLNVGNVTTYTVTGLSSRTTYFFAATAFDNSNRETVFSNEVFKAIP